MSVRTCAIVLACSASCVPATPPPATPANVFVSSSANASIDPGEPAPPGLAPELRGIEVYVDKRVPRPTQIIGVLDFHSDAMSADKGFDELRAHAAALGAEAVIGAEFEHGEAGAPSHLSGIAVRFVDH